MEEEKVIISRRKLEELEQAKNLLDIQIKEERQKFIDKSKYCIKRELNCFRLLPHAELYPLDIKLEEVIYTNNSTVAELSKEYNDLSEKNKKLSDENQRLSKLIEQHKLYSKMPMYKRVFYAIFLNYNQRYV